ncbi:MAG: BrnT family toxin [Chloroflexi bacterium]|nr:BrnT family toxin [Chloroflexota bacterium]
MSLAFEWDEEKASANLRKHRIGFEEALTVFDDPGAITIPDPKHSASEDRFVELGSSVNGRILVVVYTERADTIRIISCREATPKERKQYE